jgi:hypothetical protein
MEQKSCHPVVRKRVFRREMSVNESTPNGGNRLALQTAHYIAELTAEMSLLAQRADLEHVAYLLNLVRLEAEQALKSSDFTPD